MEPNHVRVHISNGNYRDVQLKPEDNTMKAVYENIQEEFPAAMLMTYSSGEACTAIFRTDERVSEVMRWDAQEVQGTWEDDMFGGKKTKYQYLFADELADDLPHHVPSVPLPQNWACPPLLIQLRVMGFRIVEEALRLEKLWII